MKYRITAPDGKTYEIEAPEGASEQDILSYAQKQLGTDSAKGEKKENAWSRFADSVQAFTTGAVSAGTFGLADHVIATADALGGLPGEDPDAPFSERYENARLNFRRPLVDNPVAGTVGELAGGLATGIASVAKLPQLLPALARMGPWKQAAALGAGEGAVYGGLTSPVDEIPSGAAGGAALGGAFGGAGAAGFSAARGIWDKLLEFAIPSQAARNRVLAAIEHSGLSFDEAMSQLNKGDSTFLGDLDPELTGLLLKAVQAPGRKSAEAVQRLSQRTARQGERLLDFVRTNVSVLSPKQIEGDLLFKQQQAKDLYAEAYENIELTPELKNILTRPGAKKNLPAVLDALDNASLDPSMGFGPQDVREAKKLIKTLTSPKKTKPSTILDPSGKPAVAEEPVTEVNTRVLHVLGQALDDRASALMAPEAGKARSNTFAKLLGSLSKTLKDYTKGASDAFADAQEFQAPISKARKAYRLGKEVYRSKGNAADVKKELEDILGGDSTVKPYFNAGVRDATERLASRTGERSNVYEKFANTDTRRRLGLAIDDLDTRWDFLNNYKREQRMFDVNTLTRGIPPGSASADMQKYQDELNFAATRLGLMGGPWAAANMARTVGRKFRADKENRMWGYIADMLTSANPGITPPMNIPSLDIPFKAMGLPGVATTQGEDR